MIYEQLKAEVPALFALERDRAVMFGYEEVFNLSYGEVTFTSPDFRLRIVCERGWADVQVAPLRCERWVGANTMETFLGDSIGDHYAYGCAPLPVMLAYVNCRFGEFSKVLNDTNQLSMAEHLGRRLLEEAIERLWED